MTLAGPGCVDGFRGSNIQIDLSPGTPVQAPVTGMGGPTDLPANSHFAIYGIQQGASGDQLFELARFEIHRIVDPTSPCFIDVGDPHPGLHVTQYANKIAEDTKIADPANPPPGASEQDKILVATARQRMISVAALGGPMGIKAVTSASNASYGGVAADCTPSADLIPPATCTDDESNRHRLELCQLAWRNSPTLFEGTDRVLTAPLNGVTHGLVLGANPITMAPVGGAQFFVDNALDHIDAYAIYTQTDDLDTPGTQLYFGRPAMTTRGVLHVHLVSPLSPLLTSEMAIFIDLGEDDVHF